MTAQQKPRERHYATTAKIKTFVNTARELGIKVGGFEVTPDGSIRIFNEQSAHAEKSGNDYDDWKNQGN